jgi:hypothetical protein
MGKRWNNGDGDRDGEIGGNGKRDSDGDRQGTR